MGKGARTQVSSPDSFYLCPSDIPLAFTSCGFWSLTPTGVRKRRKKRRRGGGMVARLPEAPAWPRRGCWGRQGLGGH